jgi:hypothetical protein
MRTIMLLVAIICLSAPAAAQQVKPGHTNAPEGGTTLKKGPAPLTVKQGTWRNGLYGPFGMWDRDEVHDPGDQ